MRRKPPEVLDASGLEAVTEFNQWLRGLDATAVAVWESASREARAAIQMTLTGLSALVILQVLLLGAAAILMVQNPAERNSVALLFLAGAGLALGVAEFWLGLAGRARHDEAARTRTMLEHKMGFLHEQLAGDHVSPTGARRRHAQALMNGKWRPHGFVAGPLWIVGMFITVGHAGVVAIAIVRWSL